MSEERKKILEMLAGGKITAEEAGKLLDALGNEAASDVLPQAKKAPPKHLCVRVDEPSGEKVNIRIPIRMLKAGMKLGSLLPESAKEKVASAMRGKGIDFDIRNANAENIDDLVEAFSDLRVDVDSGGGDKVNIFVE